MPNRSALAKVVSLACLVAAVAAVAMAASPTAHAQEGEDSLPPRADLSIAYDYPTSPGWDLTVTNNIVAPHPGVTVPLVKVRVVIGAVNGYQETIIWEVRNLRPGRSVERGFSVPGRDTPHFPPKAGAIVATPADGPELVPMLLQAEIIETSPVEPPGFQHNNATEGWALAKQRVDSMGDPIDSYQRQHTHGDVSLGAGISDRFPEAGGATTFTVRARNQPWTSLVHCGFNNAACDHTMLAVQAKVSLSPGLAFSGTPTAPSGTSFSTATGIWDIGTLGYSGESPILLALPVAVNLTADSLDDLPLEDRCLTAEVVRAVPQFALQTYKRANDTVRVCLGEDPKVLLGSGGISLFDYDDCVGDTAYPCTSTDTLELWAKTERSPLRADATLPGLDRTETNTIDRGEIYVQPETIIVHVPDPEGRIRSGKWSTVNVLDLRIDQKEFDAAWSGFKESVTVSGSDGAAFPGRWRMRNIDESFDFLDATDGTKVEGDSYAHGDIPSGGLTPFKIEFDTLGTYVALFEIEATKSSTKYTATGTYTFHVGPAAELEVRDGGASPGVAADRQAYTVMALNNGPNAAPGVEVTLTGVPEGAEAIASEGAYTEGACHSGLCEGVWTISNLNTPDVRRASGKTEGPTLTLATDAATPADITAAIANTQDYEVCIDGSGDDVVLASPSEATCEATSGNSWHSTAYYDHLPDNNTAAIAAHASTGEGHPDAPVGVRVVETPVANIVQWEAVEQVNGHGVTHYEVQRSASPWETLTGSVKGMMFLDMAGSGSPSYRVRAVNAAGVPGPWSEQATPHLKPGRPKGLTATGQSDTRAGLFWDAPDAVAGVTVSGYDLEFSEDGGVTWASLTGTPTLDGTTWTLTHTDAALTAASLTPDVLRQYRVRTVGTVGGATVKSDWAAATLAHPKPGVPGDFTATGESETQAELSWSVPDAVTHVAVTGYELDFSTDGGVTWARLTGTPTLDGTTWSQSHTDSSLAADAVRQYRVRAVGTVGSVRVESGWAYALATENYPAPGAPRDFAAAAASDTMVNLTWNAPEAVADVTLTGYELEVSTDRGVTWTSLATASTLGPGATTYPHTDAANPLSSKPRQYRLKAVGTVGGSTYESGWVFAVPAGEVGPPQNLAAAADGRSEGGRFIGITTLLRPGQYQAGTEASISVKAVYELADESEVSSAAETLTCTVAE